MNPKLVYRWMYWMLRIQMKILVNLVGTNVWSPMSDRVVGLAGDLAKELPYDKELRKAHSALETGEESW